MLENVEMRFILTDNDGKLIGYYNELEDAEIDAKDMAESQGEGQEIHIYELLSAQKIGIPFLQNIYELKKSYPEVPETEEKADEEADK